MLPVCFNASFCKFFKLFLFKCSLKYFHSLFRSLKENNTMAEMSKAFFTFHNWSHYYALFIIILIKKTVLINTKYNTNSNTHKNNVNIYLHTFCNEILAQVKRRRCVKQNKRQCRRLHFNTYRNCLIKRQLRQDMYYCKLYPKFKF